MLFINALWSSKAFRTHLGRPCLLPDGKRKLVPVLVSDRHVKTDLLYLLELAVPYAQEHVAAMTSASGQPGCCSRFCGGTRDFFRIICQYVENSCVCCAGIFSTFRGCCCPSQTATK